MCYHFYIVIYFVLFVFPGDLKLEITFISLEGHLLKFQIIHIRGLAARKIKHYILRFYILFLYVFIPEDKLGLKPLECLFFERFFSSLRLVLVFVCFKLFHVF